MIMMLNNVNGKIFQCIYSLMIITALARASGTTENAPFFDGRDETISNTFSRKPLGLMCSGIATCHNTSTKNETTCLKNGGKFVIISCFSSPWKNASAYCQRYGGHLMKIEDVENQVRIRKAAKQRSTCRKFWLYKKADVIVTETRHTTLLSSIRFDISISTDELLTVTLPTAELTTASSGKSALVIKIAVPLGILTILILIIVAIIIYAFYYKRKRKHVANKSKKNQSNHGTEKEELMYVQPEKSSINVRDKKLRETIERLATTLQEICDQTTMDELKKTAACGDYASILQRVNSFKTWESDVSFVEPLAKDGFFHTGPDDHVRCFWCGLGFEKWESSDVPHEEHYKESKDCLYLEALRDAHLNTEDILNDQTSVTDGTFTEDHVTGTDDDRCIMCHESKTGCLFRPCNHAYCCWECGKKIRNCGICHVEIKSRKSIKLGQEEAP